MKTLIAFQKFTKSLIKYSPKQLAALFVNKIETTALSTAHQPGGKVIKIIFYFKQQ